MQKTLFRKELYELQDIKYGDFAAKLIPTLPREKIIGVRTPRLRALAKQLHGQRPAEVANFLSSLPHALYEENNLHAFLLEQIRDFDELLARTEAFLPHIDNWATCDSFSPKLFKKHMTAMLPLIETWMRSGRTYTVRFAIGLLLAHGLDGPSAKSHLRSVADVKSEEYYVKMMAAWFFCEALAKQRTAALPYLLRDDLLDPWTRKKAVQKARESRKIPREVKDILPRFHNF